MIILAIMALHFYHVIYIDSIYYDGVIFFTCYLHVIILTMLALHPV